MSQVFTRQQLVRHGHTDPAGIVYYPRYFEMISDTIEDFFAACLGRPFGQMHLNDREGVPTVRIETDFHAPSRTDDLLDMSLVVAELGRSSVAFRIEASCGGEARFTALMTLVHIDMNTMKSAPFGNTDRQILTQHRQDGEISV